MNFLNILLQASTTSGQGQNAALQQILLIVVILVIFYFFMIRPQMKRKTTVSIEVEDGSRLRMEKSAIASSLSDQLPDTK